MPDPIAVLEPSYSGLPAAHHLPIAARYRRTLLHGSTNGFDAIPALPAGADLVNT